jgi:hypothetical protein
MRFICAFLLLTMLSFNSHALESVLKSLVDDVPITQSDIDQRANIILMSTGLVKSKENLAMAQERALDVLVDEVLIDKFAKKNKKQTFAGLSNELKL